MRRIALIATVAALAAPAGASAAPDGQSTPAGPSPGSLAIDAGNGTIVVSGDGVIFGYIDQGSLLVFSYRPYDPSASISVENARVSSNPTLTAYYGSGVRFLLPAGHYSIQIVGSGIDVSAVGAGTVTAAGAGTGSDGWIAFDGGSQVSFDRVTPPRSFGGEGSAADSSTGS